LEKFKRASAQIPYSYLSRVHIGAIAYEEYGWEAFVNVRFDLPFDMLVAHAMI
jgi:hypothetical protein